jgi:Ca2+-binding EF-hand superfamily protein
MIFLAQKGIDEDHRGQIVDELFSKCDVNNDGDVQIEEFVNYYVITKNELIKRKEELRDAIL